MDCEDKDFDLCRAIERVIAVCIIIAAIVFVTVADARAAGPLYVFGELTYGASFSDNWQGDQPTAATAGLHWDAWEHNRWELYVRGGYNHVSNLNRGNNGCLPKIGCIDALAANDKPESYLNQWFVGAGLMFRLTGGR